MTQTQTRDSASRSVNVLVNSTYIDRTHTERLRPYQPKFTQRCQAPLCNFEQENPPSSSIFTQRCQAPLCKFESQATPYPSRAVDTLVVTDSVYVEKFTDMELHDTLRIVTRDSIPYPVEVPIEVEKPIPRFYVNCTIAFWIVLLLLVLLLAAKIYYRLHHS